MSTNGTSARGRLTRVVVAVAAFVGVGLLGRAIDVPWLAGDQKGDEATYIALATSIASDFDVQYRREDYQRYRALYGHGPEGIFLKRAYASALAPTPVPSSERLVYGKAFIYPLIASPFVLLGGLGGMLVFNWLLIGVCVWCAVRFAQARMGRLAGALLGVAFVLVSDVTVFAASLTPEVFNFALVLVAYFLWLYKKVAPPERVGILGGAWTDLAAAALIGVATFSKPSHPLLVVPIGLDALLALRWRQFAALVLAFALGSGGLYAINAAATGDWNYQGAAVAEDRRSFYGAFPFDDANTPFESSGRGVSTTDTGVGAEHGPDMFGLLPANSLVFSRRPRTPVSCRPTFLASSSCWCGCGRAGAARGGSGASSAHLCCRR